MTSIITHEIEERYPYPDNGERPVTQTRLGACLASRKAYGAGATRNPTDREIDMAALAIYTEQAITATPLTPDELDLLALALWEANGERPTVYESGKAVADDVLEWWKQVAASAWGFINGTEAMQ